MKRIVKPTEDDVVSIETIKDIDVVGIIGDSEKFLVVSKKSARNNIVYCRMNDNWYVLSPEYDSIQELIQSNIKSEAFLFSTRSEAFTWLMK